MKRTAHYKDSERGAISLMMVLSAFFFFGFTGLILDGGSMFLTKIRLQSAADSAVLSALSDIENCETIASSVAKANRFDSDLPETQSQIARGVWDSDGKNFTPAADGNALRVTLEKDVPIYFLRLLGVPAKQRVKAESTGVLRQAGAIVKLGATAIDINTDEGTLFKGLLGSMLGTSLQLSAIGWQGLIDAHLDLVRFINLAKLDLNAGSTDGLLETELTVGEILELMAEALQADESTAAAELRILKQQVLATSIAPIQTKLRLGDLLQLDTNRGALAKAEVNALSMVTAVAELFNHKSAVSADTSVHLGGLLDVDLKVNIVEPPVIKIMQEGSTIHSAGARVYLNAKAATSLNGLLTNSSLLHVPLYLELGSGDAELTGISDEGVELKTGSSLAKLYLGDVDEDLYFSDSTLDSGDFDKATILDLSLLGLEVLRADAKAYTDAAGAAETMSVPPEAFGAMFKENNELGDAVGGLVSSLLDQNNLELDLRLLGLDLGREEVVNNLVGTLSYSILSPLLTSLLNPVSMMTGVFPGRTDVTVYDYAYEAVLVN